MKVQRIRLSGANQVRWLVLDDNYVPIQPILTHLQFLDDLGRSPNTIRNAACHLKLFWEFLRDEHFTWTEVDVAQLAAFITWLRRQDPAVVSIGPKVVKRTNATINQILTSVHRFYDYHIRLKTIPELPLYRLSKASHRHYKPFLYGIAKSKPEQTRVVSTVPEKRRPKTLTGKQVEMLVSACTHTRDKFLLTLMFQTGMRIGQALGLRHEDVSVEDGTIHIIPREDNPNGARAKTHTSYTMPVMEDLMGLYTDYLIEDLGALEADSLPDFVFVNLWEGQPGSPMTYAAVMSLAKRLCKKTGIHFTPHMLRHSRATIWIRDDNLPLPVVSRLLGHSSIQTTNDTYLQLTPQDLKRTLAEGKEKTRER